jgi:hypothetical protein
MVQTDSACAMPAPACNAQVLFNGGAVLSAVTPALTHLVLWDDAAAASEAGGVPRQGAALRLHALWGCRGKKRECPGGLLGGCWRVANATAP